MSDKSGSARAVDETTDPSPLASALGEIRRQIANEVKLRRDVIKPLELALRALKDPHRSAVILHEAAALDGLSDALRKGFHDRFNRKVGLLPTVAAQGAEAIRFS